MFVLSMAFIDLFMGGFVLPMRFVSAYGSPLTSKLCAALGIGESCAMSAVIYAIAFMLYTRIYSLKTLSTDIRRRYLIYLLILSWIILFLFYGIPFMTNYKSYLVVLESETSNSTSYCTTYTTSIYHPPWMFYTEIAFIYVLPIGSIVIGLCYLLRHLCKRKQKPRQLDLGERKIYLFERRMTMHVFVLSMTFLVLWLPWISIRILIIFHNIPKIQRALQIAYYILILKCALFPILYASTNTAFRGSFAIYRRQRIKINNRVWTIENDYQGSLQRRRGY